MRVRTICRLAQIHREGVRQACRVHNISNGGAMIEAETRFESEVVMIELSPEHRIEARIVWQDGARAGLRFLKPVDCCRIIREMATSHWHARAGAQEV